MSEETNHNDGTWSGLKKTIIGTVTTLIAGGGTWLGVALFQGGESEEKESAKTEQSPAAPVVINLQNNNTNQQKQSGGTNTIIKERVIEKPASQPAEPAKPVKKEEDSW